MFDLWETQTPLVRKNYTKLRNYSVSLFEELSMVLIIIIRQSGG